jgi:hypothetical protein
MANQTGTPAGTAGMSEQNSIALPDNADMIGYIEPLIGSVAHHDVTGYFGFPLIKKGETVTRSIAERAHSMARLFELIAATEED